MFNNLNKYFSGTDPMPETTTSSEIQNLSSNTTITLPRTYTEEELLRNTELAVLSKFQTTKAKWTEFLAFDKATPLERVLNLTPLKTDMANLMLLAIANFEDVKDKRYFYQKDKEYYKEQIEARMTGLFKSIQPNRMLFVELLYNLYGYYFIAKHGTKEEAMKSALAEATTIVKAEKAEKTERKKDENVPVIANTTLEKTKAVEQSGVSVSDKTIPATTPRAARRRTHKKKNS